MFERKEDALADTFPASRDDMERLFVHLERKLDEAGFFPGGKHKP